MVFLPEAQLYKAKQSTLISCILTLQKNGLPTLSPTLPRDTTSGLDPLLENSYHHYSYPDPLKSHRSTSHIHDPYSMPIALGLNLHTYFDPDSPTVSNDNSIIPFQ